MKLFVQDSTAGLGTQLRLEEPTENFQKRVSECIDERYLLYDILSKAIVFRIGIIKPTTISE